MMNFPVLAKTVGRRKTAVAKLELVAGSGQIQVNGSPIEEFFIFRESRLIVVRKPFHLLASLEYDAKVCVKGGGVSGQSVAIQLALARALVLINPQTKSLFRRNHIMTRDSRRKERRKYGIKKSRKSPQFSKRL